jgi:hypothetical protein
MPLAFPSHGFSKRCTGRCASTSHIKRTLCTNLDSNTTAAPKTNQLLWIVQLCDAVCFPSATTIVQGWWRCTAALGQHCKCTCLRGVAVTRTQRASHAHTTNTPGTALTAVIMLYIVPNCDWMCVAAATHAWLTHAPRMPAGSKRTAKSSHQFNTHAAAKG